MHLRASFAPLVAALALSSVAGCAATSSDADVASAEARETSAAWRSTELGVRPNRDVGTNEEVGLAIDASGRRHAIYQATDLKTHYVDLTNHEDIALAANGSSHAHLALDPEGNPHVALSTDKGVAHASRKNGQWVVEPIGVDGTADALAIDARGTVHIASDTITADGVWTSTVSTLAPGAAAFEHALVPGKVDGEIGFDAFAFAVDASGGEYMFLNSVMFVDDTPTTSHSTGEHTYFVRRPAGGPFSVEILDPKLNASAGSLAIDGSGAMHAALAIASDAAGGWTMPAYLHRGANDAAWSAPQTIHWDGYWSSLAVDASGNLHVAIAGSQASYGAYATRAASGGAWTIEYTTTAATQLPSLALDPQGKPVFAYRTDGAYYVAERQ